MAKFIVNSTADQAVRADEVRNLEIDYNAAIGGDNPIAANYKLHVYFISMGHSIVFEVDTTLEGIQGKAATVLAALES